MRHMSPMFFILVIGFIAVIDLYTFRGVRILTLNMGYRTKLILYIMYWLIPLTIIGTLFYMTSHRRGISTPSHFRVVSFLMGTFLLFYLPKLVFIVFQLGNDIIRVFGHLISWVGKPEGKLARTASGMTRAEFLTKAGIIVAAIPFISLLNGILRGRFNYQVKNVKLAFDNLPGSFNGYRILQISDWHIGSFYGHLAQVRKAVDLILEQKADIILFTGDIVNNMAAELPEFIGELKRLTAPNGVYSILGNHDYGEYVDWPSEEKHQENMEELFRLQKEIGFKLLRNDAFVLTKGNDKIGVAGVENWGLPPFPQYGDLDKALDPIRDMPFKILMSHDPTHWDAEIRVKSDVDLTLSGHTHGMQFGINIPGVKWSPVKYRYPRWAGLYREGSQYLYVNVGIGYIAFPGRVGFLPEITVFELAKKA